MLEQYFVKPSTVDRIRASWLAPQIEKYVEWMHGNGYAARNVFSRVPILCHFAEFARQSGATDLVGAAARMEEFSASWLAERGMNCKTPEARLKLLQDARNPVQQMLQLALEGRVAVNRHRQSFLLGAEAPGFITYLRAERGLREPTIYNYIHHLNWFGEYLKRFEISELKQLSPALLASFVIDIAPQLSPNSRVNLCGELRVFLRFCFREKIVGRDLSGAVEMPQVYRLADVPRSISWDEVRRMLEAVDRRTVRGRRDYALLLLLVTYGLRACEIAKLTLDDIDWNQFWASVPS